MKKLGLIGGIGPESTIEYYRQIEFGVRERTGALPRLAIESLSVFEVLDFCNKGDYDGLADYLVHGAESLAGAGCDFAAMTGITVHVVFDEVAARSPIPLVSMVETSCGAAEERGFRRVALLGTYPTMSGDFFQRAFRAHGIEVVTPAEDEMRYIGGKIESELELGHVVPATQRQFVAIAERLVREAGAQAVVLGCTELPMILNDDLLSAPCLDAMAIHVRRLVDLLAAE